MMKLYAIDWVNHNNQTVYNLNYLITSQWI